MQFGSETPGPDLSGIIHWYTLMFPAVIIFVIISKAIYFLLIPRIHRIVFKIETILAEQLLYEMIIIEIFQLKV